MAKTKKVSFEVLEEGYTSYRISIDKVKINPMNPRLIEDERFDLLVNAVQSEKYYLKIRPIIVNSDMIILGGNQRFKACQKAGFDSVWIINVDDITDLEQRSFIIADNADYGKWDLDLLKRAGYEIVELLRLGVEKVEIIKREDNQIGETPRESLPSEDIPEPDIDDGLVENESESFQKNSIKQIVLYYQDGIYERVCQCLDDISKDLDCDDNSEVILRLLNFWEHNDGENSTDFHTEQGESRKHKDD